MDWFAEWLRSHVIWILVLSVPVALGLIAAVCWAERKDDKAKTHD